MYKGNYGVLAVGGEIEELKDYFDQEKVEDGKQFVHISFHQARTMIHKAKEMAKESENEKPKKRGRKKAE